MSERKRNVLVLSGLDPSGGAGIQADIQAITAMGAHPLPVVTCLTIQDTHNVYGAEAVDSDLIRRQLECLALDTPIDAIKTGALGNAAIVDVLLEFLSHQKRSVPLVVDPVIKAAGGGDLADAELVEAMRERLFAKATVITPNGVELASLGESNDPADAARHLADHGCTAVLATGGHGEGDRIINRLYWRDESRQEWELKRVGGEYHGSGCTLAAAISAALAQGKPLPKAIEAAQDYVAGTIAHALEVGGGQPIPNRAWRWENGEWR
ncbi:bifunctional hydroxymethylpyrimidine kinase/phosphomethylpyrimidine kinase [Marinobacteraceae bacterium S3BR75-40.1]